MIHSLAFFIPLAEGTKEQTWIKQHLHIWLFFYLDTEQMGRDAMQDNTVTPKSMEMT